MKKLFTLAILSLSLMSCTLDETNCNDNCGTVYAVTIIRNTPANGDELYQIDYKTDCGNFKTVWKQLNLNYGYPGTPNQPIERVYEGQEYCD